MNYKIIATGSSGNCTIIDNVMIDCGISYKRIANEVDVESIDILLITHDHQDHLGIHKSKNPKVSKLSTVRKLIEVNPLLKIYCNQTVSDILTANEVRHTLIPHGSSIKHKGVKVIPFNCHHDVENYGYKIFMNDLKIMYATDTNRMTTICRDYDYYFIEANFCSEFMKTKDYTNVTDYIKNIKDPRQHLTHLSKQDAEIYITHYKKESSIVKYLHMSDTNYVA